MCRRIHILCSIGFVLSLVALGCSSDPSGEDESEQTEECPRGTMPTEGGECVRSEDDPEDAGSMDDAGESDEDSEGECGGCGENQYCDDGQCQDGRECNAGELLGCHGESGLRYCRDEGIGTRSEDCPDDRPNCRNGECHATVCEPGTTYCRGDGVSLMECSEDGMSTDQIETCRVRCQEGECIDGCGGSAKGSYIGCGFQAVDLDNFKTPCQRQCPNGKCEYAGADPITGQPTGQCAADGSQCTPYCLEPDGNGGITTGTCQENGYCTNGNVNEQQYAITVSNTTEEELDVEVTDAEDQQVASTSVPPDELEVIDLPEYSVEDSVLTDKSYNVTADSGMTVHQFNPKNNPEAATNDASLLLPSNALGTNYTVIGWKSSPAPTGGLPEAQRPYATIVAAQDGETSVTVETPTPIVSGDGVPELAAGDTHDFTLQQGEVVQLMAKQEAGNDLTGMTIEADQNVAVFSGHECATVPVGTDYCDHLEQQLFPNQALGQQYVLSKFSDRGDEDDIYRIVASQDGTELETTPPISETPNGEQLHGATLDAGEIKQFRFQGDLVVEADKPIAVSQFMVGSTYSGVSTTCEENAQTNIGDPAFMLNVGTSQFLDEYVVQTPTGYQEDWLNIVAPESADISVDGEELSGEGNQIGSTSWRVHHVDVSPGVHRIASANGEKFGLYGYGYDCDVSYAYPGGLNLESGSGE